MSWISPRSTESLLDDGWWLCPWLPGWRLLIGGGRGGGGLATREPASPRRMWMWMHVLPSGDLWSNHRSRWSQYSKMASVCMTVIYYKMHDWSVASRGFFGVAWTPPPPALSITYENMEIWPTLCLRHLGLHLQLLPPQTSPGYAPAPDITEESNTYCIMHSNLRRQTAM